MAFTLSPTALALFEDCPRCFWLDLKQNIKRPSRPFPTLPSGMDLIIKRHFDSFMRRNQLPPELSSIKEPVTLFSDEIFLNKWRNNKEGIRWTDEQGNTIIGVLDNILVNKETNKLIILEYKTRGFPAKEDTHTYFQSQLDIYNFLLRKNGFQTEDYAYVLFYYPNQIRENGDINFHHELRKVSTNVENAKRLISKAIDVLNSPKPPEPSEKCPYCRLRLSVLKVELDRFFKHAEFVLRDK